MTIFPLAPDRTIAQMWSNGARGGGEVNLKIWLRFRLDLSFQIRQNPALAELEINPVQPYHKLPHTVTHDAILCGPDMHSKLNCTKK